jgi:4-amino-4-deoxy-L-arabinose transferase-like glycosyltransferase
VRIPLFAAMALQICLSLRLQNTAFEDEALYLYAGHREIALWLHHTPTYDSYNLYFSGAAFLYPVLGAMADALFGLEGARTLSMLFMLGATWLVWSTARRLYGREAAGGAAVLFAVAAPTLYLSRFATYDPMALFLSALALWIVVRTARGSAFLVLIAAPVSTLAVGTKYAAALFIPTIACVAIFAGHYGGPDRDDGRRSFRGWPAAIGRGLLYLAAVGGLVYGWLRLLGPGFLVGIQATTTNRPGSTTPISQVVREAAEVGGAVFLIAVAGIVVDARRARRTEQAGKTLPRILLNCALAGTALLPVAYQAHLHTDVSLQKHVGFGLVFAAPVAGVALAALVKAGARDPRRLGLAVALSLGLTAAAIEQSSKLYASWPNANAMVQALQTQVRPVTGRILAEEVEVPRYYLDDITVPNQWFGTYSFYYVDKQGTMLTGLPAYQQAIADRYFDVIVLRYGPTAGLDNQIDGPLKAGKGYTLIAKIPDQDAFGSGYYYIWRVNTTS